MPLDYIPILPLFYFCVKGIIIVAYGLAWQSIDCRYFTGKVFIPNKIAPVCGRGFPDPIYTSIAVWVKLPGNLDVVYFVLVEWFGDLTGFGLD
jgi:hypothetical protein